MDKRIEELARDLAFAGYSKRTQESYVAAAKRLAAHCGKRVDEAISRGTAGSSRSLASSLTSLASSSWVRTWPETRSASASAADDQL